MTSNAIAYEKIHRYSNPSYDCVCGSCGVQFSLHVREPRLNDLPPATCPLCKQVLTVQEHYINMDTFDYIALHYNLTRETVLGIYELWSPVDGDPIRFTDFLMQAIEGNVK